MKLFLVSDRGHSHTFRALSIQIFRAESREALDAILLPKDDMFFNHRDIIELSADGPTEQVYTDSFIE